MEITIYRRHSADCPHKSDRYAPRCGCPLSGQFNWPQSTTKFDGKNLKHGQNKWSLDACTWSQAQQNATKLKLRCSGTGDETPITVGHEEAMSGAQVCPDCVYLGGV